MDVYHSCVCIFMLSLAWYSNIDCNKIKLLERQIQQIAGRQFLDSVSRQEDTAKIIETLNDIESRLNNSNTDSKCCAKNRGDDSRSASANPLGSESNQDNFVRMMKSFKEEKEITHRLRRQIPEIKKRVNALDKYLINITNAINTVSCDMCTSAELDKSLQETKPTVANSEELIKPILEDFVGKLNNLSETMQTISAKVDEMYEHSKKFASCLGHYNAGRKENGLYTVYPLNSGQAVQVYCDMTTDEGGWTVFQRRKSGLEDFYLGWTDYKKGFGNVMGEFWLGNDNIAALTRNCCHTLRIELEDFDNNTKYAKYATFHVLSESENYKLIIGDYSGNAGDSLEYHNKQEFTTFDRDNDGSSGNCAKSYKGAWWYNTCHYSNLNGLYLSGGNIDSTSGVDWYGFRGYRSLKMTEMKLK